jgi:hypothetical protein
VLVFSWWCLLCTWPSQVNVMVKYKAGTIMKKLALKTSKSMWWSSTNQATSSCNEKIDWSLLYIANIVVIKNRVWFMVFNATFNNISIISWQSLLLVE